MSKEDKLLKKEQKIQLEHNKKMKKLEYKTKLKESKTALLWVWEFSKKLVIICSVLYVVGFFYTCWAMAKFYDLSYLGTFISENSDILKTCVFGYFVKAGIENTVKIAVASKSSQNQSESEPQSGEGQG